MNFKDYLDTANLALLMITVLASLSAARSAARAAKTGDESHLFLRESNYLETRPYMSPHESNVQWQKNEDGNIFHVDISCQFKNFGQTPALDVKGYSLLYVGFKKPELVKSIIIRKDMIPPNMYFNIGGLAGSHTGSLWKDLESENIDGIVLAFILDYKDQRGVSHVSESVHLISPETFARQKTDVWMNAERQRFVAESRDQWIAKAVEV